MNNRTAPLEVLVFATSINSTREANAILEALLLHEGVKQANFDLEDVDNILRVVSCGITEVEVEQILERQNNRCVALV
ncbi:hypothetical protein [Sinomicrobium weinanense]|uniref:Uncharacterized protein n=1 Tax=Sinomicrobium weinanense TaxID=2842200 RepID=A0A926Q1G6_9FLAO|nr:hypothetical protein [Sinomicrobium weinanense]MBC9795623.1 hypothetical protein [Sinomicrobium weinanense]MBU3124644.1 hypothetical protein [Sinomicrobium weinanense]